MNLPAYVMEVADVTVEWHHATHKWLDRGEIGKLQLRVWLLTNGTGNDKMNNDNQSVYITIAS